MLDQKQYLVFKDHIVPLPELITEMEWGLQQGHIPLPKLVQDVVPGSQKQFDAPIMIREWQNAREQRKRMGNLRLLYWLDAFRDAKCSLPHDSVLAC
jgi:hypothetical protein